MVGLSNVLEEKPRMRLHLRLWLIKIAQTELGIHWFSYQAMRTMKINTVLPRYQKQIPSTRCTTSRSKETQAHDAAVRDCTIPSYLSQRRQRNSFYAQRYLIHEFRVLRRSTSIDGSPAIAKSTRIVNPQISKVYRIAGLRLKRRGSKWRKHVGERCNNVGTAAVLGITASTY